MAPEIPGTISIMHAQPSTQARGARRVAATAAIAILMGGCGGGTSTSPSGTTTTDTIMGTLQATGSSTESVLVGGNGVLLVTITSLSDPGITVGLGLGLPSGSSCAILNYSGTAAVGSALSIPVSQGIWCWSLIDTGTVQGGVDYTVTVKHP
jgi:hypothetical protein